VDIAFSTVGHFVRVYCGSWTVTSRLYEVTVGRKLVSTGARPATSARERLIAVKWATTRTFVY
jgi:hypothetical protein